MLGPGARSALVGAGGACLGIGIGFQLTLDDGGLGSGNVARRSSSLEERHARTTTKYGMPSDDNLRFKQSYVSSVNFERRVPNWVAEHLRIGVGDGPGDRKGSRFHADGSVPAPFRSSNDDFLGSGWSRGHMAPCGAHKDSQRDMDDTFALSANILPQDMSNNGSDWLRLERFVRKLVSKEYPDVYVVSGPLFLPDGAYEEANTPKGPPPVPTVDANGKKHFPPKKIRQVKYDVIGETGVAVPTHLFKIVLAEGGRDGERRLSAFVMPNKPLWDTPELQSFVVPLEFVERYSGLQFFGAIDGADRDAIPALCSADSPCPGESDTRILGWKLFGKLQSCESCDQLRRAWGEASAVRPGLEEDFHGFGLFERTHAKKEKHLRCKK